MTLALQINSVISLHFTYFTLAFIVMRTKQPGISWETKAVLSGRLFNVL